MLFIHILENSQKQGKLLYEVFLKNLLCKFIFSQILSFMEMIFKETVTDKEVKECLNVNLVNTALPNLILVVIQAKYMKLIRILMRFISLMNDSLTKRTWFKFLIRDTFWLNSGIYLSILLKVSVNIPITVILRFLLCFFFLFIIILIAIFFIIIVLLMILLLKHHLRRVFYQLVMLLVHWLVQNIVIHLTLSSSIYFHWCWLIMMMQIPKIYNENKKIFYMLFSHYFKEFSRINYIDKIKY